MKQTTTTHIAQLRGQYAYNRKQVLWLTGMTDDDLFAFQMDQGLDWLQIYTHEDRLLLLEVMKQPLIWKWWINQWNRLDNIFVISKLYECSAEERLYKYRSLHQTVFAATTPTYALMEESYAIAIGKLNDQLNHKP